MRSDLVRQLFIQDWECAYCGEPIEGGDDVAKAYDNTGIVHLRCVPTQTAPSREEAAVQ